MILEYSLSWGRTRNKHTKVMKKIVLAVMVVCAVACANADDKKAEKIILKGKPQTVQVQQDAENAPLIVVEGKVFEGDLKEIAPETIESMTVLKNAEATETYGEAGKNGVIVITLKKEVE